MRRNHTVHSSMRAERLLGALALTVAGTMSALVLGWAAAAPAAQAAATHATAQASVSRLHRVPVLTPAALSSRAARMSAAKAATPAARQGWSQVNELEGPGSCASSDCLYGWSVATSGDTMVVGAPNANSGVGEVFVYTESGGGWVQEGELTPADAPAGDFFGGSVAINSGTIVVGAWGQNSDAGAAYVYAYSGSDLSFAATQQAEVTDPGQTSNDFFAYTLALSGDSIAIGASGEHSNEGAVYVYSDDGGTWPLAATLNDPGAVSGDSFGFNLAFSGTTMVVGAIGALGTLGVNLGEAFTGAAYVFDEVHGGWVEKAELIANNGRGCVYTCSEGYGLIGGDYFGYSVAISGKTVVVSAPYATAPYPASATGPEPDGSYSNYAPDSTGTAYAFTDSHGAWSQTDELFDAAEVTNGGNDSFGYDVAFLGKSIVANAPGDPEGNATGASFVFSKHKSSWATYPVELTALDGAPYAYFGYWLTTIGTKYVVVGAPYAFPPPNYVYGSGSLYIFKI
jgi:hypothetical protein